MRIRFRAGVNSLRDPDSARISLECNFTIGGSLWASPNRPVNQMRGHDPRSAFRGRQGQEDRAFPRKESTAQKAKLSQLEKLIKSLSLLISEMLALEASGLIDASELHPDHRASARNLMDYLALRRTIYAICNLNLRHWDCHHWAEPNRTY